MVAKSRVSISAAGRFAGADHHARRPEEPAVEHITLEMLFRDRVLRMLRRLLSDGLVEVRIERLFHGLDGLGGIHVTHPHFSPTDTWRNLFKSALTSKQPEEVETAKEIEQTHQNVD